MLYTFVYCLAIYTPRFAAACPPVFPFCDRGVPLLLWVAVIPVYMYCATSFRPLRTTHCAVSGLLYMYSVKRFKSTSMGRGGISRYDDHYNVQWLYS
ncbi:hypothetical protein C2E23DRAFT_6673 [Lenzites betulinus]|nr:hypothetical protein C2E23DRAFT_6673 [Lenzites betulinus]